MDKLVKSINLRLIILVSFPLICKQNNSYFLQNGSEVFKLNVSAIWRNFLEN